MFLQNVGEIYFVLMYIYMTNFTSFFRSAQFL